MNYINDETWMIKLKLGTTFTSYHDKLTIIITITTNLSMNLEMWIMKEKKKDSNMNYNKKKTSGW
jgi:hypothetical protein